MNECLKMDEIHSKQIGHYNKWSAIPAVRSNGLYNILYSTYANEFKSEKSVA